MKMSGTIFMLALFPIRTCEKIFSSCFDTKKKKAEGDDNSKGNQRRGRGRKKEKRGLGNTAEAKCGLNV